MIFKGYYFITDRRLSRYGLEYDVRAALSCGVRLIQYREKELSSRILFEEALRLRKLCPKGSLIINDRLDIALAVNADGLHLGSEDLPLTVARRLLGPNKIIGVTVRTIAEAKQAENDGASYLAPAPIFSTNTKRNAGPALGCEFVRELRKAISLPIVAIGGIDYTNAKEVITAGADMICAISAVVTKEDPALEIRKLQELFL